MVFVTDCPVKRTEIDLYCVYAQCNENCVYTILIIPKICLTAVVQTDSTPLDSASKAKSCCAPVAITCPDVQGTANNEMLVGSQKRKARKTKITHLVRIPDGSVSPVEGE